MGIVKRGIVKKSYIAKSTRVIRPKLMSMILTIAPIVIEIRLKEILSRRVVLWVAVMRRYGVRRFLARFGMLKNRMMESRWSGLVLM